MASVLTVLYNQPKEGEFFDMDYYVNKHMPIANEKWTPLGLKSWQVIKYGPDAPFYGGVILNFEKPEAAANVLTATESQPVFDDVPNFTNLKPILLPANVEGSWERK
ncbi:hypothetical protein BBK36DRAFT_1169796 [Trichoderma citrinoviride]|uniref:EthD domain-containing protein n=1 Tax=Trichoderma citrinoviride TaxID=58853 RepID=A0A2T4B6Q7_9HYPO|nr:hypothetical protein BBK36DRAFT_1169796 [Trichoderma citrinoviride]PTB65012.1 hypothetical protein BBK36DRAFT_1169796 [Trichoderma citrinoviride]